MLFNIHTKAMYSIALTNRNKNKNNKYNIRLQLKAQKLWLNNNMKAKVKAVHKN